MPSRNDAPSRQDAVRWTGAGQYGFQLIEVLVATSLMLIAALGALGVFLHSYQSTNLAGEHSVLNYLATENVERIRTLSTSHPDLALGTHPVQSTDSFGARYYLVTGFPEEYSLRWIVTAGPTDGAGNAEAGMVTVRIEATRDIRYTTGGTALPGPNARSAVLTTFVAD